MLFFGGVQPSVISVVLSGAVGGVAGIVIVREFIGLLFQRRLAPFRRALCRSLVPVVCSAVILIGIACGVSLSWGERSASGRIAGNAWQDVSNEMETSGYRALRRQFVEWCKQDARRAEPSQVPDTQPYP
jgi:predicted DNA repair protein MutK